MIFCSDCVRSSSVTALLHLLADDGCEGELNRGAGGEAGDSEEGEGRVFIFLSLLKTKQRE